MVTTVDCSKFIAIPIKDGVIFKKMDNNLEEEYYDL